MKSSPGTKKILPPPDVVFSFLKYKLCSGQVSSSYPMRALLHLTCTQIGDSELAPSKGLQRPAATKFCTEENVQICIVQIHSSLRAKFYVLYASVRFTKSQQRMLLTQRHKNATIATRQAKHKTHNIKNQRSSSVWPRRLGGACSALNNPSGNTLGFLLYPLTTRCMHRLLGF